MKKYFLLALMSLLLFGCNSERGSVKINKSNWKKYIEVRQEPYEEREYKGRDWLGNPEYESKPTKYETVYFTVRKGFIIADFKIVIEALDREYEGQKNERITHNVLEPLFYQKKCI